MRYIDAICYIKIKPGDLYNIDRPRGSVTNGGGQTWIQLAAIPDEELMRFLEYGDTQTKEREDHKGRSIYTIKAKTIGDEELDGDIIFDPRGNRDDYRITNQALHQNRHPAWRNEVTGFPTIPLEANSANSVTNANNLQIFILRTTDGQYHAGYIDNDSLPSNWPDRLGLEEMFEGRRTGIKFFDQEHVNVPRNIQEVVEELKSNQNVLLYGPPGTGKTYVMQWLWENLQTESTRYLVLNNDMEEPFEEVQDPLEDFKGKTRTEWLTFHQNFGFEEFIVGKQMEPVAGGFTLKPKLGVLMDMAVSIDPSGNYEKGILFIDELNRGNVSKIFGQFLTFLEGDKRATNAMGDLNPMKLPVPLPEINVNGEETEEVIQMDGTKITLPVPLYFPFPIYVIASMNSVDRAVAPLDSALARRFKKIEYAPSYSLIEEIFEINVNSIDDLNSETWTARETAYLLLRRVNDFIAEMLGLDFELGHAYILKINEALTEEKGFEMLASAWEGLILPQLNERFANRQEKLIEFLKIEEAQSDRSLEYVYPYKFRERDGRPIPVIEKKSIKDIDDTSDIARIMRFLAK